MYDPHTFTLKDGSQVLLSIYRGEDDPADGAEARPAGDVYEVAFRDGPSGVWGVPVSEDPR